MRLILLATLNFISVTVSASVQFPVISTDEYYPSAELSTACQKYQDSVATKLSEISSRLSTIGPNALSVSSKYGRRVIRSGSTRNPSTSYEYYCVLKFDSKDPSLDFDSHSAVRITHVGRGNWDTACTPAYETALANPNSPISIYWKIWTLIQGRMCEVTTIEVKKI